MKLYRIKTKVQQYKESNMDSEKDVLEERIRQLEISNSILLKDNDDLKEESKRGPSYRVIIDKLNSILALLEYNKNEEERKEDYKTNLNTEL